MQTFSPWHDWNKETYLCSGEAINLQGSFKGANFFPVEQLTCSKPAGFLILKKRPLATLKVNFNPTCTSPPFEVEVTEVRDGAIRAGWQKHGGMGNCFSFYARTSSPTSSQSISFSFLLFFSCPWCCFALAFDLFHLPFHHLLLQPTLFS